jgi:protein-S-isoprenylcysteine O-methyltransferase Ste14
MIFLANNIPFNIQITIVLPVIYLLISTGTTLLIPKHNLKKFLILPNKNLNTRINKLLWFVIIFLMFFLSPSKNEIMKLSGLTVFLLGITMYSSAVFYFSISEFDKPVTQKIYSISRHPVYLSFFIIIFGVFLFTESYFLLILNILHFISTIFLLKEEEDFCEKKYGQEYLDYKKKVRMII